MIAQTVPDTTWWGSERGSCHQILLKEEPEGFDAWLIKSGEKTAERGTLRQALSTKEGHEGTGKRSKPFIKRQQCWFPTQRIADENPHKINHIILAKSSASKTDALLDRFQEIELREHVSNDRHLTEPGRHGGNGCFRNLDFD